MNRLAEKIRDARIKAGLTELQLAKKCGLQVAYILQVESGKKIINEQIADQILKKLGTEVETFSDIAQNEAKQEKTVVKPVKQQPAQTSPLAPTAQWSSALKQLVYDVPVMTLMSEQVIETVPHPVIDNKVEGHHGDKLYYLKLEQDIFKEKRLMKNDYVLILRTKQISPNTIMHFKYQNKYFLGLIQTKDKKEVIVKNDMINRMVPQKDIEILGMAISVKFTLKH